MLVEPQQQMLGTKLEELGLLQRGESAQLTKQADEMEISLSQYLVKAGRLKKNEVYEAYAEVLDVPYVDVSNFQIKEDAIKMISSELANRFKLIPLFTIRDTLNIAMSDPQNVQAIDLISKKIKATVDVCLTSPEDIESALTRYYGSRTEIDELLQGLESERKHHEKQIHSRGAKKIVKNTTLDRGMQGQTVIQLVDLILKQAYEEGASDVHVEPEKESLRIRYRIDGVLHQSPSPPRGMESEMISRLKVLAEMDIAETRIPQDGRIKMNIKGKDVDMRVSALPTVYGENIVIRILKDAHAVLDLSHLGFTDEMKKSFEQLVARPYGIILETGPTGSGKTTSLYAALQTINTIERNIITVEDPVEYKLPIIRQVPVNNKAGLGFATALRSILRQDPDVIMIGEIRDTETAEIAIQSALTGHLVLSTVHANTASSVVTRLVDMKVEPFLVASSVIGVISQRLVRRICDQCKEPSVTTEMQKKLLKLTDDDKIESFKGSGCRHCHDTGYRGRIGIFEMLKMNDEIQKMILKNASASEIEKVARETGNESLLSDALKKVNQGLTTIDEIVKAIGVN